MELNLAAVQALVCSYEILAHFWQTNAGVYTVYTAWT
jgi:hypothetical protein